MRSSYFITGDGTAVPESRVLGDWRVTSALDNNDLVRYLVRVVGYVHVRIDRTAKHILLDMAGMTEVAFAALVFELADDAEVGELAVTVADCDGLVFTFSEPQAAARHITQTFGRQRRSRPQHFRRPLSLQVTRRGAFRQLVMMASADGRCNLDVVRPFLERVFKSRYLVLEDDVDNGRLMLQEAGTGYPWLDDRWRRRAVGAPFGLFDNPDYSAFVRQAYEDARHSSWPTLESIEAYVPLDSGAPRLITYERLIVPFTSKHGSGLLSATLVGD